MNYNEFVFYDEDRDIVIKEISIHNDFIDWVGEQLHLYQFLKIICIVAIKSLILKGLIIVGCH